MHPCRCYNPAFLEQFHRMIKPIGNVNFLELWVDLLNVSEWSELEQDLLWRLSRRWGTLRHERHNYMTYGKDRVRVKKDSWRLQPPPPPPPVWFPVVVECCFTSIETIVLLETGAQVGRQCCLMSSDIIWHIRDKLRPVPKHGSI